MKVTKLEKIPLPALTKAQLHREKEELTSSKIRIKTLTLLLACLLLVGLGAFASSAMASDAKSFPILLNPEKLTSAAISLSETEDFLDPTVHLDAAVPTAFSNISGFELPEDIDGDYAGSHNGANYIAYTYYVANSGDADCILNEKMNIVSSTMNADAAVRVRVYRNGVDTTYAKRDADGTPEAGTVAFAGDDTVFDANINLAAGEQCKYTIVIWLEGDDPECTDEIKGGMVRFSVDFTAAEQ